MVKTLTETIARQNSVNANIQLEFKSNMASLTQALLSNNPSFIPQSGTSASTSSPRRSPETGWVDQWQPVLPAPCHQVNPPITAFLKQPPATNTSGKITTNNRTPKINTNKPLYSASSKLKQTSLTSFCQRLCLLLAVTLPLYHRLHQLSLPSPDPCFLHLQYH